MDIKLNEWIQNKSGDDDDDDDEEEEDDDEIDDDFVILNGATDSDVTDLDDEDAEDDLDQEGESDNENQDQYFESVNKQPEDDSSEDAVNNNGVTVDKGGVISYDDLNAEDIDIDSVAKLKNFYRKRRDVSENGFLRVKRTKAREQWRESLPGSKKEKKKKKKEPEVWKVRKVADNKLLHE